MKNNNFAFYRRIVLFQIGGTILTAILALCLSMMLFKFWGAFVFSIFATFIYLWVLCLESYAEGQADVNRESIGSIKKNYFKGVIAGLVASILPFLITLLFLLNYVEIINLPISDVLIRVFNYHYFIIGQHYLEIPLLSIVTLIPMPIATGIAYVMGYKNLNPLRKIMYK